MKKKIALLLSIIMTINLFQGMPVFAADVNRNSQDSKLGFKELSIEVKDDKGSITQKAQGIQYVGNQLQLVEGPLEDEVAMKWKIGDQTAPRNGIYNLSYYVEGGTSGASNPHKIDIEFQVGKKYEAGVLQDAANRVAVKVEVSNQGGILTIPYTSYKPPYGSNDTDQILTGNTAFKYTLNLDPNVLSKEKELVVAAGGLSQIKMYIKDSEIILSVTGIKKDYITPFNLSYDSGVAGMQKEEESFNAFKGISIFEILPTHLTTEQGVATNPAIGLPSQTVIDLDKVISTNAQSIEAGSRPGIVVSMNKPKTLDGNKFVPVDQVRSGDKAQQAELYLEELLGKDTGVSSQKQLKVSFKLDEGAEIIDTMDGAVKGKVREYQDKYELYFVKDKTMEHLVEDKDKDSIVEWPHLEAGMLLDGEVAFGGDLFGETTKSNRFKPSRIGYTYVNYSIYRLTSDDISFKVTPYNINGPVSYTLLKEGLLTSGWDAVDIRHYQDKPITDQITLTTKKGAYEKYKIIMGTGSNKGEFESQIVQYNGKNDLVPPPYSEILNIDNVYVVPDDFAKNDVTTTDISAVGLDLEWRAPEREQLIDYLNTGDIYYELYLSDSPDKVGKPIKVFKALLDGGDIKLEPYAGQVKGDLIYDASRGSFSAQGVVLKDKKAALNEWEILTIPEYEGKNTYPTQDQITVKNESKYTIPNTYYLTIRSAYEKRSTVDKVKLAISKYSNPKSLSLDIVRKVVPVPETIQSKSSRDEEDKLIQTLYFTPVDLTDYVKYMLDPLDISLYDRINNATQNQASKYNRTYEIYLYQNKDNAFKNVKDVTLQKDNKGNPVVNLSDEEKAFIREGETALKIDYISDINTLPVDDKLHELVFKGLDPNTPYYVQVRVKLELCRDGQLLDQKVHSVFSKIHSFTTSTKPVPPSPDEQVPPSPADFFIEEQVNNTSVKLGWKEPEFAEGSREDIYYELLRSDGAAMAEEDQSRQLKIEDILKTNSKYKGFHTADQFIQTYKDGAWIELDPKQGSQFLRLEENTLLSNTIYYYYIRTVLKVGDEKVYSDWISVPVTTKPVSSPIKLKVEPYSAYKHDAQHEVVVSFWAPIPKGSKVPEDFDFDIAVKSEKDADYKLDYSVSLIEQEDIDEHYKKFVYKIRGLEHSTRYDIKVRVVDKTKEEMSTSLYSDKVIARTEFSEEDQDKDNAFQEYLDVYDREADKLRRKPYWVVEGSNSEGVYKYRQSYIQAEMAAFKTYNLVSKEGSRALRYYLPSDFFEQAVKANTLVNITLDGYTATLRAGMLAGNEDVEEAREKVKKGKYEDFYIGVTFSLSKINGKINGSYAISPEIYIDMEIVYVDEEDLSIEDEILDTLNDLIDDGREDVIDDLEKEVKDGRINEDKLQRIIDKALEWVMEKHQEKTYKILKREIEKESSIYTIQKPIYLFASLDSYDVSAYYSDYSWQSVYAYNVGNGFAVEANKLGRYVFTGKDQASNLVPDIPGGSDLISKYGLSDFFNIETGLNQTVTKEKLYGAVARVMGARRGTDYSNYLKDRGVKLIIPNNIYGQVRQDEAIYIIMQAYEKMYYKDINSVYITNKLRVENIGAFQPQYRPYVYAAVELGVIQPQNNKVLPSQGVTAKDVIKMLSKIIPK